jgi:hypothetical protein
MSKLRVHPGTPALRLEAGRAAVEAAFAPEYWAVVAHRANVLIEGPEIFVADMLAAVRRDLHHPEFVWPDRPAAIDSRPATLLVREAGALPADERDALAETIWRSHSRVQVVATSSTVLYELVVRGEFPADLYYRLNVVMLTDGR